MSLRATEEGFQDYVLGGHNNIAAEIAGADGAFRETRLAIYRDAYRLRLVEVLGTDYPALKAHCGEAFEGIARAYLAAHPSEFRNVRWVGGKLPTFLREQPAHRGHPLLADLAEFEWTLGLAFDAGDAPALTFDDVAAVAPGDWPDLRFAPHPSLHVRKLRAAVVATWKAANSAAPPTRQDEDGSPVDWAVWRRNLSPHFRSLAGDEAWALAAMLDGRSFGDLCAGLCDWVEEAAAPARAAQLLRGWVDEGWIGALRMP